MGYRSRWLAVSATVPRLDLLKYPEGGPRAAASALKMLLPGWHLTGRTVGMRGGRGPEHRIFLGTWGSTIVLGLFAFEGVVGGANRILRRGWGCVVARVGVEVPR